MADDLYCFTIKNADTGLTLPIAGRENVKPFDGMELVIPDDKLRALIARLPVLLADETSD